MTKLDFLYELRDALRALPHEDTERYVEYYSEMIEDRIDDGMSEADAVAEMGSVADIAAKILGDTPPCDSAKEPAKEQIASKCKLGGLEILLLVLGFPLWFPMLIAAFSVLVSLFASMYAVVISLWSVVASLWGMSFGSIVLGIARLACGNLPAGLALFGVALFCAGVSVFAFFGCKAVTKCAVCFTSKTVKTVKKIFVRKEAAK